MTNPSFIPNVFEVVVIKHPEAQEGLHGLDYVPSGALGVRIAGVKIQDPMVTVTVVEWETLEGVNDLNETTTAALQKKHYRFSAPLPKAPVFEYCHLEVKPTETFEAFFEPYNANLDSAKFAKGCLGYAVGQQIENPHEVLVLAGWETLEDHTPGFFQGPLWDGYSKRAGPILERFVINSIQGMDLWHVKAVVGRD